jgi:C4-dicarboxylate-specific signal transduction histidine kinase
MARIIEDVLAVCRSGRARPRLRKQRVNLAAVVIDAVETVRPLFTGRGLHVAVALPPEPVSLLADPSRLHQVLTNLLTNAAEYTDPGGKICLAADVDGDDLVLRVSDNGRGIAPELLPHVFDLFRRDDRPADRSCGGLGVGLAVAKALVEQHGGGIAAFSDGPGAGSEIVVRLPDCAPRVDADQVPEAFAVFSAAALIGPLLGVASGHGAQFLLAAAVVAVAAIFQIVRRRRANAVDRWQAALDAFVVREIARDRLGERTPRRTAHLRGGFPWR